MVVAAAAGIGLIVFLLVGSDSVSIDEERPVSGDPRTLLEQALSAMTDLDSYHVAIGVPTRPGDAREGFGWEIEFAEPDSYRMLLFGVEGESEQRCESYTSPDGSDSGQTCYDVLTNITSRTVTESIAVGDTLYGRQCEDIDKNCEVWREQPRGPFFIAGPSPSFFPQWPLVALELTDELELVGENDADGAAFIHLRGSVNQLRAILENQRRVLNAAGVTSFGEECTAVVAMPRIVERTGEVVEVAPTATAEDEQTCRELTFEESLEQQEPQLSFYDENPATIDLWISPNDLLVHRIVLSVPPDQLGAPAASFTIEYSQFNEIQIEAPR